MVLPALDVYPYVQCKQCREDGRVKINAARQRKRRRVEATVATEAGVKEKTESGEGSTGTKEKEVEVSSLMSLYYQIGCSR